MTIAVYLSPRIQRARGVLKDLAGLSVVNAAILAELQERASKAIEDLDAASAYKATSEARQMAASARREAAKLFRKEILPVIKRLRAEGLKSYSSIAWRLNAEGYVPRYANRWTASIVFYLEKTAEETLA